MSFTHDTRNKKEEKKSMERAVVVAIDRIYRFFHEVSVITLS
jgi:hypothetical protein